MEHRAITICSILLLAAASGGCSGVNTSSTDGGSSTGGTMSTGATGGVASTGGAIPGCTAAAECPGVDTECKKRSCDGGECAFTFVVGGTPTQKQTPMDCKVRLCDGQGFEAIIADASDPLDDENPCTDDICDGMEPLNSPLSSGTICAEGEGTLCDGAGQCVECLAGSDCTSAICEENKCVPATCIDSAKNGAETDTDCGGTDCTPCADGESCGSNEDCKSSVCTSGTCSAAQCDDSTQNGAETDIDCGGICGPCGPGGGCTTDADCIGGSCSGTICLPTCTDGVTNADETDVDCGGLLCSKCDPRQACSVEQDCTSGVCTNGACAEPTCTDTVKNSGETGIDCGGPCPPCAAGQPCALPSDCQSGVCSGTCQMATCADNAQNGAESDVDCGGGSCMACGPGKKCSAPSDCQSGVCPGGVCPATSCGDGAINGTDTCDDGNQMGGDGCNSVCMVEQGYSCSGMQSVCVPICGDGLKVGGETCDDGNQTAGDGCSVTCKVEQGFTCAGAPSTCAAICGDGIKLGSEVCDDGNLAPGDCCSATCTIEGGCEIEPNDTTAQALNYPPLSQNGGAVTASIKPLGDVDFFGISVTNVIDLKIETFEGFAPTACTTADTFIELRGTDGTTVLSSDDDGGEGPCSLIDPDGVNTGARALTPGIYYLRVIKPGNNLQLLAYRVVLTVTALCGNGVKEGSEQCDDGNAMAGDGCTNACKLEPTPEVEGNSTCMTANGPYTISGPAGKLLAGTISPVGDVDWYSFTVPATADVMFETFDAGGPGSCVSTDTEIQLYASDCATALGGAKNVGGLGSCAKLDPATDSQVRRLAAGAYKIRVNEFGNNATLAGYTLRAVITALCGNGIVEGFEECDGGAFCDVNCNRVANCGDGLIDFPEACDDGNLANGDGCSSGCAAEIGYGCGLFGGLCLAICGNGTLNGLETCDDGGTLNGDGCDSACVQEMGPSSEMEPNDTVALADARAMDAVPVLVDKPSVVIAGAIPTIGDKDVFKLTLAAPSVVRIETFDGTGGSCTGSITTTMRLLNSTGMQMWTDSGIAAPYKGGIAGCSAYVSSLAAGTYYVQVEETGNNGTIPTYKLQIKTIGNNGSESEPNENVVHADPLIGGDVFLLGGHLNNADSDFYAVTMPVTGRAIRAELIEGGAETCESFGVDSRLTLYNYSGTQLVDDDDSGRGNCSAIDGTGGALSADAGAKNLAAGTYFLQVRASAAAQIGLNGQFDYRLVVTLR